MDNIVPIDLAVFDLAVFLAGTLTAALVTGVAGFAFGLVAAAIWLHALTPIQTTALIVAYGLLVQGYAVWKLRRALNAGRLIPLIAGSAIGVPVGILMLRWVSPAHLRIAIGILLILFSLYNLVRPRLPQVKRGGRAADAAAGFCNGVVGGSTGLAGVLIVIWSNMRGWQRDEQRAAFQPTGVATFLITLVALDGTGIITSEIVKLFTLGLPALAIGTWLGWKLYGKLDETRFRKGVLVLLLASGVALVAAG
jgi:uncharacterized membrane protein YfcA